MKTEIIGRLPIPQLEVKDFTISAGIVGELGIKVGKLEVKIKDPSVEIYMVEKAVVVEMSLSGKATLGDYYIEMNDLTLTMLGFKGFYLNGQVVMGSEAWDQKSGGV